MPTCYRSALLILLACVGQTAAAEPNAARSIHLGYPAPQAKLFYIEMAIEQSTAGSYFMAAGWNTGYFGLQELGGGKKVILFSVWDPSKGDDPQRVRPEDRVECLHQDPDVRIKRFGGEGTGGQCMADFPWELGKTYKFVVAAKVEDQKTAYAGYVWQEDKQAWRHLVTFRTRTGGQPLRGLYSFVEDFRRDGKSVHEVRRAAYGNGWVKSIDDAWQPLASANFTASGSPTEARDTINAGIADGRFFLVNGGDTKQVATLNKPLRLSEVPAADKHPAVPAGAGE